MVKPNYYGAEYGEVFTKLFEPILDKSIVNNNPIILKCGDKYYMLIYYYLDSNNYLNFIFKDEEDISGILIHLDCYEFTIRSYLNEIAFRCDKDDVKSIYNTFTKFIDTLDAPNTISTFMNITLDEYKTLYTSNKFANYKFDELADESILNTLKYCVSLDSVINSYNTCKELEDSTKI